MAATGTGAAPTPTTAPTAPDSRRSDLDLVLHAIADIMRAIPAGGALQENDHAVAQGGCRRDLACCGHRSGVRGRRRAEAARQCGGRTDPCLAERGRSPDRGTSSDGSALRGGAGDVPRRGRAVPAGPAGGPRGAGHPGGRRHGHGRARDRRRGRVRSERRRRAEAREGPAAARPPALAPGRLDDRRRAVEAGRPRRRLRRRAGPGGAPPAGRRLHAVGVARPRVYPRSPPRPTRPGGAPVGDKRGTPRGLALLAACRRSPRPRPRAVHAPPRLGSDLVQDARHDARLAVGDRADPGQHRRPDAGQADPQLVHQPSCRPLSGGRVGRADRPGERAATQHEK